MLQPVRAGQREPSPLGVDESKLDLEAGMILSNVEDGLAFPTDPRQEKPFLLDRRRPPFRIYPL
ncbi:hypothetical protein [Thiorhodococcus fuscus]|uniref:Transposase n=1 Tax=Thiorhodococcus fuscus TaxID=527200 RepID=A0ABW4Y7S9_9GAMM